MSQKTNNKSSFQPKTKGSKKDSSFKKGYRDNRRDDVRGDKSSGVPVQNDWSWYALSEQMAKDVANLPFNLIPGVPVAPVYNDAQEGVHAPDALFPFAAHLPSLMVLNYVPGPGTSDNAVSGVNMAARQMYTKIRQANSGAKNYEAPDLMMLILAMESVYLQYFELRRLYGLARTYYYANRNMPSIFVRGCGADPATLRAEAAHIRYRLNLIKEKINSIAIPACFKSFQRRSFIASNIFADSDSLRGQFYVFRADGYYKFNPTLYSTGGALKYTSYASDATIESKLDILDECIDTIITDDDMNTMCGDIVKAFGEGGLYTIPDVPEDLTVNPVYDANILGQIENSRSLDLSENLRGLDVYQENNVIFWIPQVLIAGAGTSAVANIATISQTVMLNSHTNEPGPKEVLEWTRLLPVVKGALSGTAQLHVHCGLEVISNYTILAMREDSEEVYTHVVRTSQCFNYDSPTMGSIYTDLVGPASAIQQFDWHPVINQVLYNVSGSSVGTMWIPPYAMDFKVVTPVDRATIARIHDCANYSVYYVR